MQGNIKFSIIVPVYNVERYVERCIDSIVAQTYPAYEIICVNDGSTDGSLEVLQRLADGHPSIKIIDQANKGLGGARNSGVAQATGDYIWFIDSDDWIEPGMLSEMWEMRITSFHWRGLCMLLMKLLHFCWTGNEIDSR